MKKHLSLLTVSLLSIQAVSAAESPNDPLFSFLNSQRRSEIMKKVLDFSRQAGLFGRNADFSKYEVMGEIEGQGLRTTKMRYLYKDLPVIGGATHFHKGTNGVEDITASIPTMDLSVNPRLGVSTALSIAQNYSNNPLHGTPTLKILPNNDRTDARLVYSVDFKTTFHGPGTEILLDANTGEVLADMTKMETIAPVDIHSAKGQGKLVVQLGRRDPITNRPVFMGCVFANIATQEEEQVSPEKCISALQDKDPIGSETCQLIDPRDGSPLLVNPEFCKTVVSSSVPVTGVADASATRAFENTKKTLEYFLAKFNRNSFDGLGSKARAVTDVGFKFANAAWIRDEELMMYGSGDDEMLDMTTVVDVAGHEMTHGVISKTAKLIYMDEPGALNEANADFFGKMISKDDHWIIGKGIFRAEPNKGIRDLKNPESLMARFVDAQGVRSQKPYPKHMSEKFPSFGACNEMNDRCYVHVNSTIPSHAYYRVHEKIGREKAEKVIFTALTQYLTEKSSFKDASVATGKACDALYDSSTCGLVRAAFSEVGL